MKKFEETFILTLLPLLTYSIGGLFFILFLFGVVPRGLFDAFIILGFSLSLGTIPIWKNFSRMHDHLVDESKRFKELQKKANERYNKNEAFIEAMKRVAAIDAGITKENLQKRYRQVCSERGITITDDEKS